MVLETEELGLLYLHLRRWFTVKPKVRTKLHAFKAVKISIGLGNLQFRIPHCQVFLFRVFKFLEMVNKTELVGKFSQLFESCSKHNDSPIHDNKNALSLKNFLC